MFKSSIIRTVSIGILPSLVVLFLFIMQPILLQQLDLLYYDFLLEKQNKEELNPAIAIIDIDEKSLNEMGQWPWPRYNLARLIEKLNSMGAASIGLDILLTEEDRTSPVLLKEYLKRDMSVDIDFKNLPDELKDNDKYLAGKLEGKKLILGAKFLFDKDAVLPEKLPRSPSVIKVRPPGALDPSSSIMQAQGITKPLPIFLHNADIGHIDVSTDIDGIVRRVPLLIGMGGRVYPNIALKTLMEATGINSLVLQGGVFGLEGLRLGELFIPLSPEGNFHVLFKGKGFSYPYYSATDILNDRLNPQDIDGHIVFVGTSAVGLLDIRSTPLDSFYPGVEVHASTVDAILSSTFIVVPPWTPAAQALLIVLTAICSSLLFGLSRPLFYLSVGAGYLALVFWSSEYLFTQGLFLSPVYAGITLLLEALIFVFYRFWNSEQQKKEVQMTFGQYVAPEIVSQILEKKNNLYQGERRDVSIMFTDIRGFTGLSERMEPEEVVAILNRYFTPMTAIIRNNSGTLDKFIGDALMAFWNAPVDVDKHPEKALESAFLIQENMINLNKGLKEDFNIKIKMGIGLNKGEVFVGNMGSIELLDYTIIGDSVNIASRLESMCPVYGADIVVSRSIMEAAKDKAYYIPLDRILVKGKTIQVDIFEPLRPALAEERAEEIESYLEAFKFLSDENFEKAGELFLKLQERFPKSALYSFHCKKCLELSCRKIAL